MAELGGVAYQYLSHQDELGESLTLIRERFGARLAGHVRGQAEFARVCSPDILFEDREVYRGNIEVIPTPGHTPGSTCFFVRSPSRKNYLFTGDTIYLSKAGTWKVGYIAGYSDKDALAGSLVLLRELELDVVLSSAFGGKPVFKSSSRASGPIAWTGRVRTCFSRLPDRRALCPRSLR